MKVKIIKEHKGFMFYGVKIGDILEVNKKDIERKKYMVYIPILNFISPIEQEYVEEIA